MTRAYSPSKEFIEFLGRWEGQSASVYKDEAGLDTVGVGHLLTSEEHVLEQEHPIIHINGKYYFYPLDEEDIQTICRDDVSLFTNYINSLDLQLRQCEFDSLLSLVFNIGKGAFRSSTLHKKLFKFGETSQYLLQSEREEIGKEFGKWCKVTKGNVLTVSLGLKKRREAERKMFVEGNYNGKP